ncbi:Serine acetyltransferase [Candidatus Hodgkinia cicadicola]|uniref:Serine acetyltransferase n=1 Tax=Candidatus Hodgkinia cicadicola TaxID=573658 RepID=A0ABX4MHT5_9HYPH|nr:Serine acetyltransferase [Candidatus Hodgkinia cicadicola]
MARTTRINLKKIKNSISPALNNNFWSIVIEDVLATYRKDPTCASFMDCISKSGFKVIFLYRLSMIVKSKLSIRLLRFIEKHYRTKISNNIRIGRYFVFHHVFGLSLEGRILIGDNVMIAGNVVLEFLEGKENNHTTIIHSGCNIGSNVIILNNTEVGHCCLITSFSIVSEWILPYTHVSRIPSNIQINPLNMRVCERRQSWIEGNFDVLTTRFGPIGYKHKHYCLSYWLKVTTRATKGGNSAFT